MPPPICHGAGEGRGRRAPRQIALFLYDESMQIRVGFTLTSMRERGFFIDLDRHQFRHGRLLGISGTGKSTLLRNIIVEAIREGFGIAVIDPHGDLIYDIFNYIPASRLKDIVYIDPENDGAPDLGIFDHPDKEKAVQAFMSLMEAHAGSGWGPETAHIIRRATDAVIELRQRPFNQIPATNTFAASAPSMNKARANATATLLPDGNILIAGGSSDNSTEIYDAATNTFAASTPSMNQLRSGATATLLPNGKVFIAAGSVS